MNLADGIEAWGQAHKKHLDRASLEKLGSVWSTVRAAEVGSCLIADMSKDDARDVMALFDEDERGEIAELLNAIRTWSLDYDATSDYDADGNHAGDSHAGHSPADSDERDLSHPTGGTPLVVPTLGASGDASADRSLDLGGPGPAATPLVSDMGGLNIPEPEFTQPDVPQASVAELVPEPTLAPTPIVTATQADYSSPPVAASIDPMQQNPHAPPPAAASRLTSPVVVPQGPAPALPPPLGYESEAPAQPPWMWIAAGCVAILVLAGLYFVFSGGDDTPTEAGTDASAESSETAEAAQADPAEGSVIQGAQDTTNAAITGTGGADFCTVVGEYTTLNPLGALTIADGPTYFEVALNAWGRIARVAPAEITNDVALLQTQTTSMNTIAAQFSYNTADPGFATSMQSIDVAAADQAAANIATHTTNACGAPLNAGLLTITGSSGVAGAVGVNPEVVDG